MVKNRWVLPLIGALVFGFLGIQLGNHQAEAYLRAKYPWTWCALPQNIQFKGFYFSDNPQVFLETTDGKIFRIFEGDWLETNPDEIEQLEKPPYPYSTCARENLASDLPIPTLSVNIIDQMACKYSFSPETIGYRQYALLENGALYMWSIDLGPLGIGKNMIFGFFTFFFGTLGAAVGAIIGYAIFVFVGKRQANRNKNGK